MSGKKSSYQASVSSGKTQKKLLARSVTAGDEEKGVGDKGKDEAEIYTFKNSINTNPDFEIKEQKKSFSLPLPLLSNSIEQRTKALIFANGRKNTAPFKKVKSQFYQVLIASIAKMISHLKYFDKRFERKISVCVFFSCWPR